MKKHDDDYDDDDDDDDDTGPPFKSKTNPTLDECQKWEKAKARKEATLDNYMEGIYGCSRLCDELPTSKITIEKIRYCKKKFVGKICDGSQPKCGTLSCGFGSMENRCK